MENGFSTEHVEQWYWLWLSCVENYCRGAQKHICGNREAPVCAKCEFLETFEHIIIV